jgi:replicative DNA helicase
MEKPTDSGRVPPHSGAVEQTLICCIFDDGGSDVLLAAIDGKVTEKSFWYPNNALLWKTALWLHKNGKDLSMMVLTEELKKLGKLDQVGGYAYISEVLGKVGKNIPNTAEMIKTIQELYMQRELITAGTRLVEASYLYNGDAAKFIQVVEDCLALREGLEKQKTMADACDDAIARVERIAKGEQSDEDVGLSLPWPDANKFLGPIQNGELVVLGARPSRGKSSLARQLAYHWADRHGPVDLFSREMPIGQLPFLFAQSMCGHSWRDARYGKLHAKDLIEFSESLKELKKIKNLRIHDRDKTFAQVFARVRAMVQMSKPKAILIDYLQIYDVDQQKHETRDMAIGRITKGLKDLAVDLNIPIILLVQISRSVEKEEREPRCSDIRESGNCEQDADRIWFAHWNAKDSTGVPQNFNDQDVREVEAKLIQAKGRGEGMATCDLLFKRPIATFFSMGVEE